MVTLVQAEVPDRAHRRVPAGEDGGAWPAQQAADAGGQLLGGEGFGHVVICAHGEPDEGVDLVGSGGQLDHVGVGEGAQLTAYLDAVDPGHHHVEHDDVGGSRRVAARACSPSGAVVTTNPSCSRYPATTRVRLGSSSTTSARYGVLVTAVTGAVSGISLPPR